MKSEKIFKAYFELGQFGLPINEVEYIIKVLKSFSYLSKRDGLGLPHINIENDTEPTPVYFICSSVSASLIS